MKNTIPWKRYVKSIHSLRMISIFLFRTLRQAQTGDDTEAALSFDKLVTPIMDNESIRDYSKPQKGLRAALLDHFQEIETELETDSENLCAQAAQHIHSSELILTLGHSRSVENFLKSASKERKFEVVVAECAPECRVSHISFSRRTKFIQMQLRNPFTGSHIGRVFGQSENRDNCDYGCSYFRHDVTCQ